MQRKQSPLLLAINAWFYKFQCNLCDADYVGYTTRHLHQRIIEHKYLAISRHIEEHGLTKSALEDKKFSPKVQRRFTIQRKSKIKCKKAFLKRKVLSLFLKTDTDELFLISNVRAFRSVSYK